MGDHRVGTWRRLGVALAGGALLVGMAPAPAGAVVTSAAPAVVRPASAAPAVVRPVSAAPAVVRPAPAGGVVRELLATPSTRARKPRAKVTTQYWRTVDGVVVTVRSNATKVRIKYRTAGNRARTKTVTLADGERTVVLPKGAKKIRAVSRATSQLRASRTVKAKAGDSRFTIVVVPDTQQEAKSRPDLFESRTRWIAENRTTQDIRFVIQVGDLVDTDNCGTGSLVYLDAAGTRPQCSQAMRDAKVFYPRPGKADHYQYVNASAGLTLLEQARIPFALAVGNHDTAAVCGGPACVGGSPDWAVPSGATVNALLRSTGTWNNYFPASRFGDVAAMGFFELGRTDNMYQTFRAGGLDWMVLSLELWPREEVVAWAAGVVANHPRHNVLVNTHHLLAPDGTVASNHDGYGDTTPQYLFDNLLAKYPNIRMTFSGHVNGSAMSTHLGVHRNPIQSFVDGHTTDQARTRLLEIDTVRGTLKSEVRSTLSDPDSVVARGSHVLNGVDWTLPQ
jgi:Calcineurin-like phosphoesterase